MKKKTLKLNLVFFALLCVFFVPRNLKSQQFYRIKADYSVKYKGLDGQQVLQLGVVFYDVHSKTIVIKNNFPSKNIIAQKGSETRVIQNSKTVKTFKSSIPVNFSIFHLALIGNPANFGLDQLGYKMKNIKKEKGLVMTSWSPNEKLKKKLGDVLISTKNKQLFAIIFLDTSDKIIAKHFYRKYTNINGFMFPTEIVRISYINNKQIYELTSYKNIELNEFNKNENYYNFNFKD